jgi:hypothetical protein
MGSSELNCETPYIYYLGFGDKMPKIEDVEQAKAVALYEFRKKYPYGVKVRMNAQRMSDVWIVRMAWDNKESEYRIDANTGEAWKIK